LVITIGTICGGERSNIVADKVTLTGTARYFDPQLREKLQKDLHELFATACSLYGCKTNLIWTPLTQPVINEDRCLLSIGQAAVCKMYGKDYLGHQPAVMISEDFSCFGEKVPSLFCFLGGGNPRVGAIHPHHSSCFQIDEEVLPRGAALYAQFAVDYLKEEERRVL